MEAYQECSLSGGDEEEEEESLIPDPHLYFRTKTHKTSEKDVALLCGGGSSGRTHICAAISNRSPHMWRTRKTTTQRHLSGDLHATSSLQPQRLRQSTTLRMDEPNDPLQYRERKKKRGPKPRSKRKRQRPETQFAEENESPIIRCNVVESGSLNLRVVQPYLYTFASFAKARWLGRTILDVYSTEFGGYTPEYYDQAIRQGRILVSNERVQPTYVIQGADVLMHKVHRHEPAVAIDSDKPPFVKIAAETDDVLAVDKPSTLPIHPCGGYHMNSLMKMLEEKFGKLYTIHRLDRLTSGLVVLGKTSAVAQKWATAIQNHECEKLYLARVHGCFPVNCPQNLPYLGGSGEERPVYGEWLCDAKDRRMAYGYWFTDSENKSVHDQSIISFSKRTHEDIEACLQVRKDEAQVSLQWLKLACPVRVVDAKRGVCQIVPPGEHPNDDSKAAQSCFALLRYDRDTDTSVVLCKPETGRTHQLRLHLQALSHCICNDPNYGGELWSLNERGRQICQEARERMLVNSNGLPSGPVSEDPATSQEVAALSQETRDPNEQLQDYIKRTCIWCRRRNNPVDEFLVRSPGIWLHALQYTIRTADGTTHSFRAALPPWC